jgi:hypothetical protein
LVVLENEEAIYNFLQLLCMFYIIIDFYRPVSHQLSLPSHRVCYDFLCLGQWHTCEMLFIFPTRVLNEKKLILFSLIMLMMMAWNTFLFLSILFFTFFIRKESMSDYYFYIKVANFIISATNYLSTSSSSSSWMETLDFTF